MADEPANSWPEFIYVRKFINLFDLAMRGDLKIWLILKLVESVCEKLSYFCVCCLTVAIFAKN
jgi:hypothetical protein